MKSKNKIDDFFKRLKKKVAEEQQEIISSSLRTLFNKSPHEGTNDYAKGEYDANHKISINHGPASAHHDATGSLGMSRLLIDNEIRKTQDIKSGDKVVIFNTTGHSVDVEYGADRSLTWQRDGDHPYRETKNTIKTRYQDVLK